ncbi:MAG: hypothetical protein JNM85_04710 [Chthonomonas sp.]|nr:hypothetical protein [Chthonomonas sp.]
MLTAAITLLLGTALREEPALPKTFEEVQRSIGVDMRKLKAYRDSWLLTTTTPTDKVTLRVTRSIDGDRGALSVSAGGQPVLLLGSNAKMSYFIYTGREMVAKFDGGNAWLGRTPTIDPKFLQDGDFNMNFDGIYDLMVSSRPGLTLTKIENSLFEGVAARLVSAQAKRPGSNSGVTVRIWVGPDTFVPLRAEADVVAANGTKLKFTAVRDRVDTAAKFPEKEFDYPEDLATGYQTVEWKMLVPGFAQSR